MLYPELPDSHNLHTHCLSLILSHLASRTSQATFSIQEFNWRCQKNEPRTVYMLGLCSSTETWVLLNLSTCLLWQQAIGLSYLVLMQWAWESSKRRCQGHQPSAHKKTHFLPPNLLIPFPRPYKHLKVTFTISSHRSLQLPLAAALQGLRLMSFTENVHLRPFNWRRWGLNPGLSAGHSRHRLQS